MSMYAYSFGYIPANSQQKVERPIAKHYPVTHICSPCLAISQTVLVPNLARSRGTSSDDEFEHWSLELYEWLGLVAAGSPRVLREDNVDPFLSRYQVPDATAEQSLNMVTLTWVGLIPASWIRALFMALK